MTILYQDTDLIALNKPASLPTQADETGDASLLQLAEQALSTALFVIHRLDRPTSGVVVFAKHEQAAAALSQQFQSRETQKKYFAIVEKKPKTESGTLVHFLAHNPTNNKSYPVAEGSLSAKRAEMRFILRGSSDRYFLLELALLTGRHHQIRAQLSAIGCPIKGDVKYGARRSNLDRSIHLHAAELILTQPTTGEQLILKAEPLHKDALWQFFEQLMPV